MQPITLKLFKPSSMMSIDCQRVKIVKMVMPLWILAMKPKQVTGAVMKEAQTIIIEQLTADQLLSNAELNATWLRGVQKNPARFLAQKFYLQNAKDNSSKKINKDAGTDNEK